MIVKRFSAGDSPEVCQRSFAALRMTARGVVILSAAKDLEHACVQQTRLTSPWGLMGNYQVFRNS